MQRTSVWRKARHATEAAALRAGLRVLRILGPVRASNVGGYVARHVGPRLPVSRIAAENIRRALPDLDAAERRLVVQGVWDNLGRTAAELPHLPSLRRTTEGPGWECGDDSELRALQARGGPALLFSGHLANWEIGLPVAAALGLSVAWFYRPASNAASNELMQSLRREAMGGDVPMFPKSAKGGRAALAHLRQGGLLGMLIDQKLNEGIAVPFFGRAAMTTTAPAQFALRLRCPVIPILPVRLRPGSISCGLRAPAPAPRYGGSRGGRPALTLAMTATLERWIREQPECWLWLHRRWPKDDPASTVCHLRAVTEADADSMSSGGQSPASVIHVRALVVLTRSLTAMVLDCFVDALFRDTLADHFVARTDIRLRQQIADREASRQSGDQMPSCPPSALRITHGLASHDVPSCRTAVIRVCSSARRHRQNRQRRKRSHLTLQSGTTPESRVLEISIRIRTCCTGKVGAP